MVVWVAAHDDALRDAEPDLPAALSDRAQEVLEPLAAIADVAGGPWPGWIRDAAAAVIASTEPDEMDLATQLLADIRSAFDNGDRDAIFTVTLLHLLNADDEQPWASWREGRRDPKMNPRDLSAMLKRFRIRPRSVRVGAETQKGYRRKQFADAWRRYLPV